MPFEITYYHDYISEKLAAYLLKVARPFADVDNLLQVGNQGAADSLETAAAMHFLCDLYSELEPELKKILNQRILDRKFIDERVSACFEYNKNLQNDFLDPEYKTILELEDATGRIVIGPLSKEYCQSRADKPIAPIPDFLRGSHVTLFGPPGTAKMAINAMNTYHRKLKDEPLVVAKLLSTRQSLPKWGADDEDSKTPLRADLVSSAVNLTACFDGTLSYSEDEKKYELAPDHLSVPIKRFPGLALPCTFLFYKNNPLPLHLYDFALHLFKNWHNPKALVFYVPKLENEEEAQYIHKMVSLAEAKIKNRHPAYVLGSVRLMVVLENPRAILRTHEIIDALYPYFVGASLGWHDYLASTARLFKNDGNYRIPVKADPDIVIKYIKASHNLLSDVVGSRGGIKVGGMYGILPLDTDLMSESFQITIKGYIKDVITQMKRNLTGFWVAHPDFVRLGLALVEGWRLHAEGDSELLTELVQELLDKKYHQEILEFINKPDIVGLDKNDPQYVRSLLVADIKESDFIANNDPEEIRYNIFQSLQYLTDWLCGNGCVALPAHVHGVAVRVMDDLATAERSRWEVWHEIRHGRVKLEDFLKIAFEEYNFIRKDLSNKQKIVQVKWNETTQKWYPIALRLMIQLMTAKKPVEFATELLLPFTLESIREADDPLNKIRAVDTHKYQLDDFIERFMYYFEICGCLSFASEMAQCLTPDISLAREIILNLSKDEMIEAAAFHGNIGEDKKTLDAFAKSEQSLVFDESASLKEHLLKLSDEYLKKFGLKFLISAQSKTGQELLEALKTRLKNTEQQEIHNAQEALWQISLKRLTQKPLNLLTEKIESLRQKYHIHGVSLAINLKGKTQSLSFGEIKKNTWFELASLSKTLAAAFSIDYFTEKKISLDSSVNHVLAETESSFRLKSDLVTLRHLLSHSALNMHYVKGYPLGKTAPSVLELLDSIDIIAEPGKEFHYSGGGFIVLEHIIESLEKKSIQEITFGFFHDISFTQTNLPYIDYATGYFDDSQKVSGSRLMFPAFAAGALGTSGGVANFLNVLTHAFHHLDSSEKISENNLKNNLENNLDKISHDTAVQMLYATDKGCRDFMGCDMGLGVFVAEAGDNKFAIHQGANEGFRCLYLHCFSGPDCGNGFVILCNADNKGVLFNAEVAQEILKELKVSGIDFNKFKTHFDDNAVTQENRVNASYKNLIFDAFLPALPEEIINKGPKDPLAPYNLLTTARINKVSNQKFARASNMISPYLPTFDPELFGKQGKIMDSWESARHNPYEMDYVELTLLRPSQIHYVRLSTKYHDGNQAEFVRILGLGNKLDSKLGSKLDSNPVSDFDQWVEILPKQKMLGHSFIDIKLEPSKTFYTQIKIEMYPDGGLTRVGLYDKLPQEESMSFLMTACQRFQDSIPASLKPLSLKFEPTAVTIKLNKSKTRINLAGAAFGAKLISATNEHYSPASQLLSPYPPIHMFDGLESARSRQKDNFEEVIIQLADESRIKRIILDFKFFVNNNPLEVSIDGLCNSAWMPLAKKTNVKAYAGNIKEFIVDTDLKYTQLKIKTFPDGGINRLYVFAD